MNYLIKKGEHYCRHWPKIHLGVTKVKFRFRFGAGCWFPLEVPDDYAINKLFGIGYANHHKNSFRVGWTPSKQGGKIDLFFYVYYRGIRIEEYFTSVDISSEYEMEMEAVSDLLSFKLIDLKSDYTITNSIYFKLPWFRIGMVLMPFVGGKLPARTDTYIDLTF